MMNNFVYSLWLRTDIMVTIWNCYFLDLFDHTHISRIPISLLWHFVVRHTLVFISFFSDSLDQPSVPCDFWEVAMAIDVFICWPCLRYWCWMNILSPCEPISALMFLACTTYVLYLHHLNIPVVWSLITTCTTINHLSLMPQRLWTRWWHPARTTSTIQNYVRWRCVPYLTNSTYHIHLPAQFIVALTSQPPMIIAVYSFTLCEYSPRVTSVYCTTLSGNFDMHVSIDSWGDIQTTLTTIYRRVRYHVLARIILQPIDWWVYLRPWMKYGYRMNPEWRMKYLDLVGRWTLDDPGWLKNGLQMTDWHYRRGSMCFVTITFKKKMTTLFEGVSHVCCEWNFIW